MRTRLQNGDRFPDLSIRTIGDGDMVLPRDVEGFYSVILFYRGAWCPYCTAQLAAFARARASLQSIGLEVVALSVDDEAVSTALVEKMRLNFPVGFGVKADEISEATGAYLGEGSAYLMGSELARRQGWRVGHATCGSRASVISWRLSVPSVSSPSAAN